MTIPIISSIIGIHLFYYRNNIIVNSYNRTIELLLVTSNVKFTIYRKVYRNVKRKISKLYTVNSRSSGASELSYHNSDSRLREDHRSLKLNLRGKI